MVLRKDAPYKKPAAVRSARSEFQETLYLRAIFIQQVISLGFDLVLSHLDTVWYEDPLPFFASSPCDMHVQFEAGDGKAGAADLLALRANRYGRTFVNDYLECEFENYQFISLHGRGRFTYSDDPDIDCVELISSASSGRQHMRRCALDPLLFVSERTFFDVQLPQHKAVWPMFVHLNARRRRGQQDARVHGLGPVGRGRGQHDADPADRRRGHSAHGRSNARPPPARIAMPGLREAEPHALRGQRARLDGALRAGGDARAPRSRLSTTPVITRRPAHHPAAARAREPCSSQQATRGDHAHQPTSSVWPPRGEAVVYLDAYVGPRRSGGWTAGAWTW